MDVERINMINISVSKHAPTLRYGVHKFIHHIYCTESLKRDNIDTRFFIIDLHYYCLPSFQLCSRAEKQSLIL